MDTQMVKCPFNPLHIMSEESLQRHIVKCMKNYPNWITCPYNALHKFPNSDTLSRHMVDCPFKETVSSLIEIEYALNKAKFTGKEVPIHLDNIRAINLSEENWDKEYQH